MESLFINIGRKQIESDDIDSVLELLEAKRLLNPFDNPPERLQALRGSVELLIDGYNVLTTVESALAHGLLLIGRDGCMRDLASMHGSWRKVDETAIADGAIQDSNFWSVHKAL